MSSKLDKFVDRMDKLWSEVWLPPIVAAAILFSAGQAMDTLKKNDPLPPKPPGHLPKTDKKAPKKGWEKVVISKPKPYVEHDIILEPHIRVAEAWIDLAESMVYDLSQKGEKDKSPNVQKLAQKIQVVQNIVDVVRKVYAEGSKKLLIITKNEEESAQIDAMYEKALSGAYEKITRCIGDAEKDCGVVGQDVWKQIVVQLSHHKNTAVSTNSHESQVLPGYTATMKEVYALLSGTNNPEAASIVVRHRTEDILEGGVWDKFLINQDGGYRHLYDVELLPILATYISKRDAKGLRDGIKKFYGTHPYIPLPDMELLKGDDEGEKVMHLRDIMQGIIVQSKSKDLYAKLETGEGQSFTPQAIKDKVRNKKATLEQAYGIDIHTGIGNKTEEYQSAPADIQRQLIILEYLQKGLALYPKSMLQHMHTMGLSIGMGQTGPLEMQGWSTGKNIHIIYTDDIGFFEIVFPHELCHSFDVIDPEQDKSDKSTEQQRENPFFSGFNRKNPFKKDNRKIFGPGGYARTYGTKNTNEDKATVAENFTPKDFYDLVIEAVNQDKNDKCAALRYKIEAMIGCRILVDEEGKVAIGKEFKDDKEYCDYFRDKTDCPPTQREFYSRWSKGHMGQEFWGNLLAGNQPIWDGEKYLYIPVINSQFRSDLQKKAIQPLLSPKKGPEHKKK